MRTATVAEVQEHLPDYLEVVEEGGSVSITERGRPIARLVPVSGVEDSSSLSRSTKPPALRRSVASLGVEQILSVAPIRTRGGVSAVELLVEERRLSR